MLFFTSENLYPETPIHEKKFSAAFQAGIIAPNELKNRCIKYLKKVELLDIDSFKKENPDLYILDIKKELLNFEKNNGNIDTTQNCIYIFISALTSFSDVNIEKLNINITAALLLVKANDIECSTFIGQFKKKLENINSKIFHKNSRKLYNDIMSHLSRKFPEQFIEHSKKYADISYRAAKNEQNNIILWHQEINRRKLLVDTMQDVETSERIKYIWSYIKERIAADDIIIPCKKCIYNFDYKEFTANFGFFNELFYRCDKKKCYINLMIFDEKLHPNEHISKIVPSEHKKYFLECIKFIEQKYLILFPDLILHNDIDSFTSYNDIRKNFIINKTISKYLLEYYDYECDYGQEKNKHLLFKKTLNELKKNTCYGRYEEKNNANIMGMIVWDKINLVDNKKSFNDIVIDIMKKHKRSDWFIKYSMRFKESIAAYSKGIKKNARIELKDFFDEVRDDYTRIDISIRTGKIHNTQNALKNKLEVLEKYL